MKGLNRKKSNETIAHRNRIGENLAHVVGHGERPDNLDACAQVVEERVCGCVCCAQARSRAARETAKECVHGHNKHAGQ